MNNLGRNVFFLAGLLSASIPTLADNKQQDGVALLARARQLLEIRALGKPAFRLAAQFRLLDPELGNREGTYQEVWVSPERWRREITAGDYHQIEIMNGKKRWVLHPLSVESNWLDHVRPLLWRTVTDLERPKVKEIHDEKVAGVEARCVETKIGDHNDEIFCLKKDAASGVLLSEEHRMPHSVSSAEYFDYGSFGSQSYARTTRTFLDGKLSQEVTITELVAEPTPDKSLFVPSADLHELPNCEKPHPPQVVSSPDPDYEPKQGKSVSVVLWVIVDTDGTIRDVRVTRPSGESKFDAASLETVRRWRFKPATCDRQPLPVAMNIMVTSRF